MSSIDLYLANKYKTVIGLDNIQSSNSGITFLGGSTVISNLYVSNGSILNGNLVGYKSLNVSKSTNINLNLTALSLFNNNLVSNNININNLGINRNVNINNNINISGISILNNGTILSSLYVNDTVYIQDKLYLNNINLSSIIANNINIGNPYTLTKINGTLLSVLTNNLQVVDKYITLNCNTSLLTPLDNGNNSGIEIYGISGNGYLRTDLTSTRYEIKPPLNDLNYIIITDSSNNLSITGKTLLYNNVSINSSLYVSNNSLCNNSYINNNLFVSNISIFQNATLNSSLYVSTLSILNNNVRMNNNLYISGTSNIYNSLSCLTNLNINNYNCKNISVLSNLVVNNITNISGQTSLLSDMNCLSNNLFTNLSVNSNLYVSGNSNLLNTTINSSLYVSGYSNFNNHSTLLSSFNCPNNTIIKGNITLGSLLGNTIINSWIIAELKEYYDNTSAKMGGIVKYGLYRTADIVKIQVDDLNLILTLLGNSTVNLIYNSNTQYIEPGVIVYNDTNIKLYIISIHDGINELLNNPIEINGNVPISTSIINSNTLNTYTITYSATNYYNITGYNTRIVSVSYPLSLDVFNGSPTIINRDFNGLNSSDFTVEAWIYSTTTPTDYYSIFDFEDFPERSGTAGARQGTFSLCILPSNRLGFFGYANSNSYTKFDFSDISIPLNKWCHVVWMRKNNNLYGIINGISSSAKSTLSTPYNAFNNLSNVKNLAITIDTWRTSVDQDNINSSNLLTDRKFKGYIRHPLVRLGYYYDPSILFVPSINLTPTNNSSLLFFLDENMNELVSNTTLAKIQTVSNSNLTSIPNKPTIVLNGSNIVFINIGTSYQELGATCYDFFGNVISSYTTSGTVNINTIGVYEISYSVSDNYGNSNFIQRSVNVISTNIFTNTYYWIDSLRSTSITKNSSNVISSVVDVSGNNITMVPYSSSPNFLSSGINGLPVLDFTNNSSLKSSSTYSNSYNVTLAIVVTFFNNTNNGIIWGHFNNRNNDICLINTSGTSQINWCTNNDTSIVQLPYISGVPVLYIATLTNGNARYLKMINLNTGVETFISGSNSVSMTLANCPFYLGSSNVTSELSLCYVGECMYWKSVLSASDLSYVQLYLYTKWKLNNTINLPPINIYKPVIILSGPKTLYVYKGTSYNEPGVLSSIDYTGTISYTTTNNINTSINGTYNINYIASNIYGTTTETRKIIVYSNINSYNISTNSSYIKVSNVDFSLLATNNITIEYWVYITNVYSSYLNSELLYFIKNTDTIGSSYWYTLLLYSIASRAGGGEVKNTLIPSNLTVNSWNHIAYTKSNNNITAWVNGTQQQTATNSNMNGLFNLGTQLDLYIGRSINGYISQFCISKYIKYTTTFTPSLNLYPTSISNTIFYLGNNSYDFISNKQVKLNNVLTNYNTFSPSLVINGSKFLLLSLNSTYTESGVIAKNYLGNIISYGTSGFVNTNNIGKYNITYTAEDTSIYRNIYVGMTFKTYYINNNYLYSNNNSVISNLKILSYSNEWTIEFYINMPNNNGVNMVVLGSTNTSYPFQISTSGSDTNLYVNSSYSSLYNSNFNLTINTWHHIAIQRNNNNLEIIINGNLTAIYYNIPFASIFRNSNMIVIGSETGLTQQGNYYISQVRINKKKRYSPPFTPELDLYTDNLIDCIFALGNNYNDLITNTSLSYNTPPNISNITM
jgi:hypothetical protein